MDTKYVVALDQGTTSSRTDVLDKNAKVVAVAQREFPQTIDSWIILHMTQGRVTSRITRTRPEPCCSISTPWNGMN